MNSIRITGRATRQFIAVGALCIAAASAAAAFSPVADRTRGSTPLSLPATPGAAPSSAAYGRLPMRFEPNQGQAPAAIRYLARGAGYSLGLDDQGARLSLRPQSGSAAPAALRIRLAGASRQVQLRAEQPQASRSNYFVGKDRSRWQADVPNFGAVRYSQVYPGIDWLLYGNPQHLEYDLVVAPQADPAQIRLKIEGADQLAIDDDGNLAVTVNGARLVQQKPVSYQTIDGKKLPVESHYLLDAKTRQIAFALGDYDHRAPLTIDPVLMYSTYLGGASGDLAFAIAVDASGNAYIAGETLSSNFPTTKPPFQNGFGATQNGSGDTDAFVAKFNPAGALVFSTYLGGNGNDSAAGIAVDGGGFVYIAGNTNSTNFPTVSGVTSSLQPSKAGGIDAFVAVLRPAGNVLYYGTYLGGSGDDYAYAIAVNKSDEATVAGSTTSPNFPVNKPLQMLRSGASDAFVTKINQVGNGTIYSTYLGGSGDDSAQGIALDSSGNAYVAGSTNSSNFPTTAPMQAASGGDYDAFVTKLNADGSARVYSTYLGGSGVDFGYALAVDAAGNAYITGITTSTNFPTTAPFQAANAGGYDAFVTKLNSAGSARAYSTYLGGAGVEFANAIAVDSSGQAYVAGSTFSTNFPTQNPLQAAYASAATGTLDGFVSKLSAAGAALAYSTYFGGSNEDQVLGIAVDSRNNAYIAGGTQSIDFPALQPQQAANAGGRDAFIARIGTTISTVQFDSAHYVVDENAGYATITVERSGAFEGPASVKYGATNGTATADINFTAVNGTLSWTDGDTAAKTIVVPIIDNTVPDPDRNVNLSLSAPGTNTQLGSPSTAVLVINDDDAPAAQAGVAFSAGNYSVSEAAGTATISMVRTGSTNAAAKVELLTLPGDTPSGGTALPGVDYTAVTTYVSWVAGDSSARFVTIPIIDNFVESGDKTVLMALAFPTGVVLASPETAVLTINDDEAGSPGRIQLNGTQFSIGEGGSGTVNLGLMRVAGSSGQACVQVATADASAIAGIDYTATAKTVCFNDSQAGIRFFPVPIINNSKIDGTRSFAVTLSNPSGGGLGAPATAAVSITDDDAPVAHGSLQLSAATYSVAENVAGGAIGIPIQRVGGASGAISVRLTTSFSTSTATRPASAGSDYSATDTVVTWANGDSATKMVDIPIINDAVAEGDEVFNVGISEPGGSATLGTPASAVVTIVDDDVRSGGAAAQLAFGSAQYRVTQGAASALVTVNRTGSAAGSASVQLLRPADPLTHGSNPVVDTVTFADGDASTKTIEIPLAGYNLLLGTQQVPLRLQNPSGASLGDGPADSTLTVVDGRAAAVEPAGAASGGALAPALLLPMAVLSMWRRQRRGAARRGRD